MKNLMIFVLSLMLATNALAYVQPPYPTSKGGTGSSSQSASKAVTTDSSGHVVSTSSTTDTEIGFVHGVTGAIQPQIDAKQASGYTPADANNFPSPTPSALPQAIDELAAQKQNLVGPYTGELHVAKNGSDTDCPSNASPVAACGNGSVAAPFLTITHAKSKMTMTGTSRNVIVVHAGVYTEDLALANDAYLLIKLEGANIVGNLTWTISASASAYAPKLIIQGNDLRSYYSGVAYIMNGITGNVVVNQGIASRYANLQFVASGVTGNITVNSSGGQAGDPFYIFAQNGGWTGTLSAPDGGQYAQVAVYAFNSMMSSSAGGNSIGGASGHVYLRYASNIFITAPWTGLLHIAGGSGATGTWYGVTFPSGTNDWNGIDVGTYSMDANSYSSFKAHVTNNHATLVFLDVASGVGNDSSVTGTSVKDALNTLLAAIPTPLSFVSSLVNSAGSVSLVNDSATPGNSKYYGTNSSGTKGFFDFPASGVTSVTASAPLSSSGGSTPNITLGALNGTSTAIQKGNGSGMFSDASYSDVTALFTSCTGSKALMADGTCVSMPSASAETVANGGDAAYAIQAGDKLVRSATTLTAGRAYTLPACTVVGEIHKIKNLPAQSFNITLTAAGADLIDGAATLVLLPGDAAQVECAVAGSWDIL